MDGRNNIGTLGRHCHFYEWMGSTLDKAWSETMQAVRRTNQWCQLKTGRCWCAQKSFHNWGSEVSLNQGWEVTRYKINVIVIR